MVGWPHPGPVVLKARVDVERGPLVGFDGVALTHGRAVALDPMCPPVPGDVDAAVVAGDDVVGIGRVEVQRMVVDVDVARCEGGPGSPSVSGGQQGHPTDVEPLGVDGVHAQQAEVVSVGAVARFQQPLVGLDPAPPAFARASFTLPTRLSISYLISLISARSAISARSLPSPNRRAHGLLLRLSLPRCGIRPVPIEVAVQVRRPRLALGHPLSDHRHREAVGEAIVGEVAAEAGRVQGGPIRCRHRQEVPGLEGGDGVCREGQVCRFRRAGPVVVQQGVQRPGPGVKRQPHPPHLALLAVWEPPLGRRNPVPRDAPVPALPDARTRTRSPEVPCAARPIPHRGIQVVRVSGVHHQIHCPRGRRGTRQLPRPGGPCVAGLVYPSDGTIGRVQGPQHRDPRHIRLRGMQHDAPHVMRPLQPRVAPVAPPVVAHENPRARIRTAAAVHLPRPHPDPPGHPRPERTPHAGPEHLRPVHRHRPNRHRRLPVETRRERRPVVARVPEPARRVRHVKFSARSRPDGQIHHPPPHSRPHIPQFPPIRPTRPRQLIDHRVPFQHAFRRGRHQTGPPSPAHPHLLTPSH